MESEKVKSLIKTTALYSILIGGLLYLQFYQRITIPIPIDDETFYLDPTFLFLPLISLLTFNYASKVVKSVVVGKLGPPLSSGISRLGIASFFWLLTIEPGSPTYLLPFGNFVFVAAFVLFARSLISTIFLEKNQIVAETVTTSAAMILIGLLTSNFSRQINLLLEEHHVFTLDTLVGLTQEKILLGLFYSGLADVLDESILLSSIFISAISLTGIFRSHPNPYLDYLGKRLGKGLGGKFLAVFSLLLYVLFLREFILSQAGINPQIVTVAEWGTICIISYGIYRRTRGFVSESLTVSEEVGYWTRHIQEIEHKSDIRLDNLAGLVEGFIRSGERDELIVYIADAFRRFNVTVASISTSLSVLINHREIEIGLTTFSWQKRMLERMNLERRHEALMAVLGKLQELALKMTYKAEPTSEPFIGQETHRQEAMENEN